MRFVLLKKYLHHYLLSKLLLFTLTHLFPVWFILTYLNIFFSRIVYFILDTEVLFESNLRLKGDFMLCQYLRETLLGSGEKVLSGYIYSN